MKKARKGLIGGPGAIRTPDPFLRREVLCPAELRKHKNIENIKLYEELV